jgi:AraC-like DNA-binding protein
MKTDLPNLNPLTKVIAADQLTSWSEGPVEIRMTHEPISTTSSIEDCHERYEFLIPLNNLPHLFIDRQAVECRPGQMIIIRPHTRHGVGRGIQDGSFISVFFQAEYLENLAREIFSQTSTLFLSEQCLLHSEVQAVLVSLITELRETRPARERLAANLTEQLAIQLIRHYHISQLEEPRLFTKPLTEIQSRFQPVLEYMQENLEEKLTIDRLAELAHMNRFHFIRAFKQAFGQSPYEFLTDLRITKARRLLVHTRLSANEIGNLCGFFSASRFSAAFRQNTGMTPSAYRAKVLSEQRSLEHFRETAETSSCYTAIAQ